MRQKNHDESIIWYTRYVKCEPRAVQRRAGVGEFQVRAAPPARKPADRESWRNPRLTSRYSRYTTYRKDTEGGK